MQIFLKYGTVIIGSMFKFIIGPITGVASGLAMWETFALTVVGMMTSVFIMSFLGQRARQLWIERLRRQKTPTRMFTKANRRVVGIWRRFGLHGIAFCTPIFLSPIGGTIVAIAFGETPKRILPAMLVSAIFWGMALTWLMHVAGEQMLS